MTHSPLRCALSSRQRQSLPRDAYFLLVVQLGEMRHCVNMCTHFERRGFHVVCGDKVGRRPETLQFIPDAIVCRVEGGRRAEGVRPEFESLDGLRRIAPEAPMVVLLTGHAPSPAEADLAAAVGAVLIAKRSVSHDYVLEQVTQLIRLKRG